MVKSQEITQKQKKEILEKIKTPSERPIGEYKKITLTLHKAIQKLLQQKEKPTTTQNLEKALNKTKEAKEATKEIEKRYNLDPEEAQELTLKIAEIILQKLKPNNKTQTTIQHSKNSRKTENKPKERTIRRAIEETRKELTKNNQNLKRKKTPTYTPTYCYY